MFTKLIQTLFSAPRTGKQAPASARKLKLRLEPLEDRSVPANLYWIGGDGALWNSASNWYNQTTGAVATSVPGSSDSLHIGGSTGNSSYPASTTGESVDDFRDLTVTNFTIHSNYQGTVRVGNLSDSSMLNYLRVSDTFDMQAGTMTGNFFANTTANSVHVAGTANWSGGTISSLYFQINSGAAGNLSGGTKTLDYSDFYNYGTTTWTSGNISFRSSSATSQTTYFVNHGTFIVQTAASILRPTGSGTTVLNNYGTIEKESSTTSTLNLSQFNNYGSLLLQNGTLDLSVATHAKQGLGGLTSLEGGHLQIANSGTYVVNDGTVTGAGTITGNLSNGEDLGGGITTPGGTILPGSSTAGGTITVTGHYYNLAGTLRIYVFARNDYGKLEVQGNAYLYGNSGSNLRITNTTFSLNANENSLALPVFTYSSVTGGFNLVTIDTPSWSGYTANAQKTSTVYNFNIVRN